MPRSCRCCVSNILKSSRKDDESQPDMRPHFQRVQPACNAVKPGWLVILMLFLLQPGQRVEALPMYWCDPPGQDRPYPYCTEHPDGPYGDHPGLVQASSTDISIAIMQGSEAVQTVCPGETYKLQVMFNEPKHALITVTQGAFASNEVTGPAKPNSIFWQPGPGSDAFVCLNRLVLRPVETSVEDDWIIPCNATGDILLEITAAWDQLQNLQQMKTTVSLGSNCNACQDGGGNNGNQIPPSSSPVDNPPPAVSNPSPSPGGVIDMSPPPAESPPPPPNYLQPPEMEDPYYDDIMWYVDEYDTSTAGVQQGSGNDAMHVAVSTLLAVILPTLLAAALSCGAALL